MIVVRNGFALGKTGKQRVGFARLAGDICQNDC